VGRRSSASAAVLEQLGRWSDARRRDLTRGTESDLERLEANRSNHLDDGHTPESIVGRRANVRLSWKLCLARDCARLKRLPVAEPPVTGRVRAAVATPPHSG